MAENRKNIILHGISGRVGNFIVKHYADKTVVTSYPDMSGIKPTDAQKEKRNVSASAVAYAKEIINDPRRKMEYQKKVKKGKTVYHYVMREYLRMQKGVNGDR